MPQQDKIKREIDRIGLALSKLLGLFLQKPFNHSDAQGYIAQQLRSELDIDLEVFLEMQTGPDLHFLIEDKKFSIEHLRNFANLLYELAHKTDDVHKKKQLQDKALNIYKYIDSNGQGTLYLDVQYRIKELKA